MILKIALPFTLLVFLGYYAYQKQIGLHREIWFGAVRCFFQLLGLGLVLNFILKSDSPGLTLALLALMSVNSVVYIFRKLEKKPDGFLVSLTLSMLFSIWPLAAVVILISRPSPWYNPSVLLPLVGILLGNTVNGIYLGIETYLTSIKERKYEIEEALALGATSKEACHEISKRSIKVGMTSIINSMATMGIVSIPGMMTGQILGGTDAINATIDQIMIVFSLCCGVFLGICLGLFYAHKKVFNEREQLCWR